METPGTRKELLVRVASKTNPNGLGESIAAAYQEGYQPVLDAIGPAAVAQAFKGVCAANRFLVSEDVLFSVYPTIIEKTIQDRDTHEDVAWVAMRLRLVNIIGVVI